MTTTDFFETGATLIGRVSEKLMVRKMLMATAESCTGGLAASLCTSVPGSSRWFSGAVVSYANSVKTGILRVDARLVARFGAVSAPVVEAMARGGLEALGADVCVSVSGIAGPDGGTPEKPVGTVWFATALRRPGTAAPAVESFSRLFHGGRLEVRFAAAFAACEAVEAAVDSAQSER